MNIGTYFITRFFRKREPLYYPFGAGGGGGGRIEGKFIATKIVDHVGHTYGYKDNQKKKLIEDIWRWLHENNELEIVIKKNTK